MECKHEFVMCRLCLCETESFIDIFQVNEWVGYVAADVIRDLLQFQVSETDAYPNVVCSICLGKLMDFKQFKQQCQNSIDTYDNVFASDESHPEHPIDIVEQRPVKSEPKDPLDTEEPQQEVRKRSAALASPEYLACRRCEPYRPYENSINVVNDDGKPSPNRRKNAAVDNLCENVEASGSAKDKVGKTRVRVGRECKRTGERRTDTLPDAESDEELRIARRKTREEADYVDAIEDATHGEEETSKGNAEREDGRGGRCGREGGGDVPPRASERGRRREHFRCLEFGEKNLLISHLEVRSYDKECGSKERDSHVGEKVNCGSKRIASQVRTKELKRNTSYEAKKYEGIRKFVCDLCGKGFNWVSHMKRHLRVHGVKKPFVCALCSKEFSDKYNLKTHKLIHTGEKRCICEICGKPFAFVSGLVKHRRVHSGEKPFICQVCGKAFKQKNTLIVHFRGHTGEKPYQCQVCRKWFKDKGNIRKHFKKHSQEKQR